MDVLITDKSGREPARDGPDGPYIFAEGDPINISVTEEDIAELEIEGFGIEDKKVSRSDNMLTTGWTYFPKTFAGLSRFRVTCGDLCASIDVDIAPSENKLGKEAFLDLIDELEARIPGLPWGVSPGHFRSAFSKRSAMIARPRVIEAFLEDLKKALRGLRFDPLLYSRQEREIRRMSYTRRPDIQTVQHLAQSPQAAVTWHSMVRAKEVDLLPIKINQAVSRITHDHPVTRYLVWLLRRLLKDLEILGQYLDKAKMDRAGGIGDQGRAYCNMLSEKLAPVFKLLRESLNRPPLLGLKPSPLNESAAQALFDHPPSLRLHRIARRMMARGLIPNRDGGTLVGLRETWELYEYLVLFRMAEGLAQHLGTDWNWKSVSNPDLRLLREAPSMGTIRIENGGQRIELRTQVKCPRAPGNSSEGFSSLSQKREPDYVLAVFDEESELVSWVILDAKFRTKKQYVLSSLGNIHVYRDSLRWHSKPPAAAFAIIPKIVEGTALYASQDYHDEHQFGVLHCPLEPDEEWLRPVIAWLEKALAPPTHD